MSRTIIDVHVLQTVPPSNLNRDDTGTPKSAVYGGVRRARVSSQAWKRATREAFKSLLDPADLGLRSRRMAELVAERITALDASLHGDAALALAAETLRAATGSKIEVPRRKAESAKKKGEPEPPPEASYLMFLSARQIDGLARLAIEGADDIKAYLKSKENKDRARGIADSRHSVDIALFGRMVADSTDFNVDAAAQVAHAISVHQVENESDYFTAVDDKNEREEESGAGMIGTVDFNSATLYRYAALDVDRLRDNLGVGRRPDQPLDEPVRRAVRAFIEGFVASMPTGKINTFGNHTLPEAVIVTLRSARPVSFVAAFEEPVLAPQGSGGHLRGACAQLLAHVSDIEKAYEVTDDPSWVLRAGAATEPLAALGTAVTIGGLLDEVSDAVAARSASSVRQDSRA
ncbi:MULTISPECIES: type I-E CRISPR-associated protein Cas7/Cse4/CasC [Streptomyces]|uniref:Type I-E CRISPR-associated protein Cas7/Cse4/CasC n=1 Tax=Streptomyces doudnae TaxID=3075536 RepID=A0ABD5EZP3_9ACTN|nr:MULTISPECIES: type I-E CRISPR-associated protein Cas7/Cse4/CasC [unclassified Streptomyces]MDT0439325.1 type I-E CRISPR-associated protein Cas7/Cse4/CasC [Streptomyces sp. DSM 41981]MYQ68389.1 type I-E CRISPR-associated protein Cas7/Cse4/CasC [Streptomyces sp. SID4950]SCE45761.1 CRISPR system Cascade subunit CasC [Streptomyces sp. SolWspMP-5a-2]